MNIPTILAIIFSVWWLLWILIALVKRGWTMAVFLVVTGSAWAYFESGFAKTGSYIAYGLLAIPILILTFMVRIIPEYERGVLFRLGRQRVLLPPGVNLIFPLGIDKVTKIDLRIFTIDVPKQEVITMDNVPVMVDAVVYYNVFDPRLAVNRVADFPSSTSLLAQTMLRSVLGQHELDELLAKRSELNEALKKLLDEATDPWGIKITAVEIKSIELPDSMKRAMAKQAEAERERRAKIIAADGEFEASDKLAQAAERIDTQASALQLRYLQTLSEIAAEKNSTILFPLPMEFLRFFDQKAKDDGEEGSAIKKGRK